MTITGIFISFIILFLLIYQKKLHDLILNPFLWICVSYILYFGFADISNPQTLITDFANLIGFVVFSIFYYLAKTELRARFFYQTSTLVWPIKKTNSHGIIPLSSGTIIFLTIIFFLWVTLDLYTNAIAFGSLNTALVRFYTGSPINEIPILTIRILNILFTVSVGIILIFRLNGIANKNISCQLLFWLMIIIYEIAMIPRGTVGYIIQPAYIILITDSILIKKQIKSNFPYMLYIIIFPLILIIGFALLTVRGGVYNHPQEAIEALDMQDFEKFKEVGDRSYSIVFEYTEKIINSYGNEKDYLLFYTPYSILVNLIPREIWPEKPYGFGKILAIDAGATEESGVSFAAGIAGEGFANGGWIGIIFLAALIGILCGFFAKFAFTLFQSPSIIHLLLAFQAWLAAQYFVRGDMLSAWAQAVYPLVFSLASLWSINKVIRLFKYT